MRCGQCGVPAQIDLDGGREPADMVADRPAHIERRLGLVVLHGDLLHRRRGQPSGQRANPGRVAVEQLIGESVDLVVTKLHGGASLP